MSDLSATAREFIESFNERQLDRFVETLHPGVRIHAGRGLRTGRDEARRWATRSEEGIQQRIVVEELISHNERVLALIDREWWWQYAEEDDEFAHHDLMGWLFSFEDGLISEWRPFDDRAEAKAALGSA